MPTLDKRRRRGQREGNNSLQQQPAEQVVKTRKARDTRFTPMAVSGVIAVVLAVAATAIPVPYVIESPGPAINTIGEIDSQPIISISGHESFPDTQGSLDLTTVHLRGGLPQSQVNFFDAFRSWLTPSHTLYPAELIYAPGTSQESVNHENAAAMTGSQENATAAALTALGMDFETNLAVVTTPEGSAAAGILAPNDVLLSIDGTKITGVETIKATLAKTADAPVSLKIRRDSAEQTVKVTPKRGPDGNYLLGVTLQNTFDFPFDVKFLLENIGGPSAGMMFALGIMDKLTPGDLTGGKHFAGTGTITADGKVGSIGGIAQKMVGAKANGAEYFLAPAANCQDVVGHIPDGLQVVKVDTLKSAYDAVSLIGSGKDGSKLPRCE